MAAKKNSFIRLGLFVIVGTFLLLVAIFYVGDKQALFTDTFKVRAHFHNIEGLRSGASVWLSGITVGTVSRLTILPDTTGMIEVEITLEERVRHLIKTDSKATIKSEGLVGNKVLVVTTGSGSAPKVKEGDLLGAVNPLSIADLMEEVQAVLHNAQEITVNANEMIYKLHSGEGTIAKLLNDDRIYENSNNLLVTADQSLQNITSRIDTFALVLTEMGEGVNTIVSNIDRVVGDVDTIIAGVQRGEGLLGMAVSDSGEAKESVLIMLDNFIKITEDLKLGTFRFAENMEALKRNWLFRSYFEERGYYDKTEYEMKLDGYMNEINQRMQELDDRIDTLKDLQEEIEDSKEE
jgi:phospholipid/cholesterol/gamma-HCH transport system substrate-binding protein